MANSASGVVKRVVADKGFGFIRTSEGAEYFFHRTEVIAPLSFGPQLEGQRVTFTPQEGPRGPRASAVVMG